MHRYRVPLVTTLLFILVLITGIVGTAWQAIQAVGERDRALASEQRAREERQRAQTAEDRALAEAAISKAINEFLINDLLGMAEAQEQSLGGIRPDPEIRLRTVLDRAAKRIADKFDSHPLVEAAIRLAIGESYASLGEDALAIPHLERAKHKRTQHSGEDAPATVVAELALLRSLRGLGKYQMIAHRLDELAQHCVVVFGEGAEITLNAIEEQSHIKKLLGNYFEAESLARQVFERRQLILGTEHAGTLISMATLARCIDALGRHEEAEQLYRKVLRLQEKILGIEDPRTLNVMSDLGSCLTLLGKNSEAEELLRQVVKIKNEVLGSEHPSSLQSIDALADCIHRSGRHAEAEKLWQELVDQLKRVRGPEHPLTLLVKHHLANCLLRLGQKDKALEMTRDVLKIQERILGPTHPETLGSQHLLATCLGIMGRNVEAEKNFRVMLETVLQVLGPEHPNTFVTRRNLAVAILNQGRNAEVEPLLREQLEATRRVFGPKSPQAIGSLSALAVSIANQDKKAEAEKLFKEELELERDVYGSDRPNTLLAQCNLAHVIMDLGRFEEAERLCQEALEIARRALGSEHPSTSNASSKLSEINSAWLESLREGATAPDHELQNALEATQRAVELMPNDYKHLRNLGVALYFDDQWKAAGEALEKAGAGPEQELFLSMSYWQQTEERRAIEIYTKAVASIAKMRPGNKDKLLKIRDEAEHLMDIDVKERNELVAEFYSQIDETNHQALAGRGQWHHVEGRHLEAVEVLTAAMELDPEADVVNRIRMRGDSYAALGNDQQAIRDYTKAVELDSRDEGRSGSLAVRAAAYQRQGHLDLALEDISESIPLRSSTKARHHYLQRAGIYRQLRQYENALADCQKSIDINPKEDTTSFARQDAYELRGDIFAEDLNLYEKAVAEYAKALELDPDNLKYRKKLAAAELALTGIQQTKESDVTQ